MLPRGHPCPCVRFIIVGERIVFVFVPLHHGSVVGEGPHAFT